jgi:serine/threonine protein kinase
MQVAVPIRDEGFQVIGAMAFRIRSDREFTRILEFGQIGESGETYAFNKTGVMVSNSRFDEQLILLGLLPDEASSRSQLRLSLRDPGGNMQDGFRPAERRAGLPLTRMAERAIAGESGVDLDGYRDYRGVPVVGAWAWLPELDMGIAIEMDYAEAFRPLTIVQWMFRGIFALLTLCSIAIFVFTLLVARARREAQKAAVESRQLGQYVLEQKLGAGAMGVVYKGRHAMLRRPTAIKMLNLEIVNETSIARFEREVQITSQLNHPNTIAIYDFGRTPEGVFYYAMEFLDGIDLQKLVDRYGPLPEARVIKILTQICGSLFEAHARGLVHRDIKPANVMLNRRGGEPDLVKVLDFGLVKAIDDQKQANASSGGLTGTPLYMSPEAIQFPLSVDARSDIYAVGAVGYFLLTGKTVFEAGSLVELCQQHVSRIPEPPSARLNRPVSHELEDALMACLEKDSAKRPQTARELALRISKAPTAHDWAIDTADAWWGRHERNRERASSAGTGVQENDGDSVAASSAATMKSNSPGSGSAHETTLIGHSPDDAT